MIVVATMPAPPSTPLKIAAGSPETVAPMAIRRTQTKLETTPEISRAQLAGAASWET